MSIRGWRNSPRLARSPGGPSALTVIALADFTCLPNDPITCGRGVSELRPWETQHSPPSDAATGGMSQ